MTGHVEHVAVSVVLEALCSQCDTLIEGYVIANDTSFADDDTRSVVNSKILADLCPRVNVDARMRVSLFGDDARYDGYLQFVQLVSDAIVNHCADDGIAEDDFAVVGCCGVVVEHRLYIGIDDALYFR